MHETLLEAVYEYRFFFLHFMNYSHPHNINTLSKCCLKFITGGLPREIPGVSDLFHCIKKLYEVCML